MLLILACQSGMLGVEGGVRREAYVLFVMLS
jgi:hypothetical protein